MLVEHRRQRLRVASCHAEHDRLAPRRRAAYAILPHEALLEAVAELAHYCAVALGDGELPLKRPRVHRDAVRPFEQFLELVLRRLVHCAPVEFVPPDLEAAVSGGLNRHRLVDAVGHEMPRIDGFS